VARDVAHLRPDTQGLLIGALGNLVLSGLPVHRTDIVPGNSDMSRLANLGKGVTGVSRSSEGSWVVALQQAHAAELGLANGNMG
jgi:hypothetical protein